MRCRTRRGPPGALRAALGTMLLLAHGASGCDCPGPAPPSAAPAHDAGAPEPDPSSRPSALQPTPREPGPPRVETAAELTREEQQASAWVKAMLGGGLPRREVASMADIRGYRLYRHRRFGRAAAWFEQAARTDPTYEPALFNAARVAALRRDIARAVGHLRRLERCGTPLSRRQLEQAASDPDFAALRAAPPRR